MKGMTFEQLRLEREIQLDIDKRRFKNFSQKLIQNLLNYNNKYKVIDPSVCAICTDTTIQTVYNFLSGNSSNVDVLFYFYCKCMEHYEQELGNPLLIFNTDCDIFIL